MKNVDDLIESAGELARRGFSKGEIADELNVSRETARWLVDRSGAGDDGAETPSDRGAGTGAGADDGPGPGSGSGTGPGSGSGSGSGGRPAVTPRANGPQDIHVDWSAVGRDSARLRYVGCAMADMLSKHGEDVDLTIGIEKAGAPLATVVALELDTDLGAYAPRKHQWNEGDLDDYGGSFSRNFATIRGRDCYVVDDTITSGTTMRETIDAIREEGGDPMACVVVVDKQGLEEVEGVPVYSLINVVSVAGE